MASEPTTVEEAMSCPEKKNWKEAMDAEFQSLHANELWDLVTPPKGCKVIGASLSEPHTGRISYVGHVYDKLQ